MASIIAKKKEHAGIQCKKSTVLLPASMKKKLVVSLFSRTEKCVGVPCVARGAGRGPRTNVVGDWLSPRFAKSLGYSEKLMILFGSANRRKYVVLEKVRNVFINDVDKQTILCLYSTMDRTNKHQIIETFTFTPVFGLSSCADPLLLVIYL